MDINHKNQWGYMVQAVSARMFSAGRRFVFRLLSWNPWQHVFFRFLDQLRTSLGC